MRITHRRHDAIKLRNELHIWACAEECLHHMHEAFLSRTNGFELSLSLSWGSFISVSLPPFDPNPTASFPSYPTDLIWRKGIPFEAMTSRTAPSSDGLLAEVFWGFPRL